MKSTVDKKWMEPLSGAVASLRDCPFGLHARNKQRKDEQHFIKWNTVDFAWKCQLISNLI